MFNRYAVKKSGNQRFSTILYRLRRMAGCCRSYGPIFWNSRKQRISSE